MNSHLLQRLLHFYQLHFRLIFTFLSIPIPYSEYLYLSILAFLVKLTNINMINPTNMCNPFKISVHWLKHLQFCVPYSKWLFASKINWIKCSFFNSFLTSKCFVLFQLAFLLRIISLISKSVYVTKFARANPAPKTSAVNLLNSGVVIYLSWLWSATLFSISPMFVL